MKKILVVGGAGYIGSITSKILEKESFTPIVFDNFQNSNPKAVERYQSYAGDLRNYHDIDEVLKTVKPHGVIHFAALKAAGESMEMPEAYYENNVGGSANLFKAMIDNAVDKVVFSSTAAVYGDPERLPILEDDLTNPQSPYGHSKLQVEEQLNWLARLKRLSSVRLRYFNVAGALEDGSMGEDSPKLLNLVPRLLKAVLGQATFQLFGVDYDTRDGTNVRDYIHVVDLAYAHVRALEYLDNFTGSNYFNVGVGEGYSNIELIKMVEEVTGKTLQYETVERRPGDPGEIYASNDKARQILGWEPKFGLREIVEHAWMWHSTHPNGYE